MATMLVLATGAWLAMGGVSSRNASASPTARIETPSTVSAPQSFHWADADRDVLDLQLD